MSDPVWMYRKGEARLFASPEEVPQGDGWTDSPAAPAVTEPEPEPVEKPQRKAKRHDHGG